VTEKRPPIRLGSETHKQFVASLILKTPSGYFVTIEPPRRSLDQNAALHAKLTDIAEQLAWPPPPANHGLRFSVDTWKRLCMAAWLREEGETPDLVPALDGHGFDIIYQRTSKLTVAQASRFLEWVTAFGAQNGVQFHEVAANEA
jgi:hypothetical protein